MSWSECCGCAMAFYAACKKKGVMSVTYDGAVLLWQW